jgi:flagellar biosynthesis/type III secretory pathway M-ring protein FliF/YscJ
MYEEEDYDDPDIESIKKKVDVPLEQIRKMSRNNPEAVAMLLKSWMMEESK